MRLLKSILIITLLVGILPLAAYSDSGYIDVSPMSDEDFFGTWKLDSGVWEKQGVLNYDYSPNLKY